QVIVDRGKDRDAQTDRLWVTNHGVTGAEATLVSGELAPSTDPETNSKGAILGRRVMGETQVVNFRGFGTAGRKSEVSRGNSLVNSVMFEDFKGRIGIGTLVPTSTLTVAGRIETKAGGIRFPDGTVQLTSASGSLVRVNHNSTLSGDGTKDSPLGVNIHALG